MEVKCAYSVVSRGTERRRTRLHGGFDGRFGYINIAHSADQYWIRPLAHGVAGSIDGALCCTSSALATVAIARIQLVAASALHSSLSVLCRHEPALVIGTGAIALGAVLELKRLGCPNVVIHAPLLKAEMPTLGIEGVSVIQSLAQDLKFGLVIDAVSTSESIALALAHSKTKGVIGLLGSPDGFASIDLYKVHRNNLNLIGLHELNESDEQRQVLLEEVHRWLESKYASFAESVCRIHPAKDFSSIYPALLAQTQPFLIHCFDWSEA
ncbi:hypothetical protein [Pseudomonas sp. B16120]|jgi:threonine dehydrogenase-like Zn-dependent dehydrogenase|uniref:hypothetical protein n=1 Tax=Pseudomonas sp. B16120 TaxID=3235108 RepID=UPI00378416A6